MTAIEEQVGTSTTKALLQIQNMLVKAASHSGGAPNSSANKESADKERSAEKVLFYALAESAILKEEAEKKQMRLHDWSRGALRLARKICNVVATPSGTADHEGAGLLNPDCPSIFGRDHESAVASGWEAADKKHVGAVGDGQTSGLYHALLQSVASVGEVGGANFFIKSVLGTPSSLWILGGFVVVGLLIWGRRSADTRRVK